MEFHECKEQEGRQYPPPPRGGWRGHEWKADAWQKTSGRGRDGGSTAVGRCGNHDFPPPTNETIPLRMEHAEAGIDGPPQYSPAALSFRSALAIQKPSSSGRHPPLGGGRMLAHSPFSRSLSTISRQSSPSTIIPEEPSETATREGPASSGPSPRGASGTCLQHPVRAAATKRGPPRGEPPRGGRASARPCAWKTSGKPRKNLKPPWSAFRKGMAMSRWRNSDLSDAYANAPAMLPNGCSNGTPTTRAATEAPDTRLPSLPARWTFFPLRPAEHSLNLSRIFPNASHPEIGKILRRVRSDGCPTSGASVAAHIERAVEEAIGTHRRSVNGGIGQIGV